MITAIRRQFKERIIQVMVGFLVFVFCLFFMLPDNFNYTPEVNWIARINGQVIDPLRFARIVRKQEMNVHMIREQYGNYADMFLNMLGLSGDLKESALREIMRGDILNKVVQQIPLYINESYIERTLNDSALAQRSGITDTVPFGIFNRQGLDQRALALYLSRNQLNMQQFEHAVQEALAHYIVLQLASLATYVPSAILDNDIKRELATKNYTILKLSFDDIKKTISKKRIVREELEAFFDRQNKESQRYFIPEMRAAMVWQFTPEKYGLSVSDEELHTFYEKHKSNKYLAEPAKVQVRHILLTALEGESKEQLAQRAHQLHEELLLHPETFEQAARMHSQDAQSAAQGGLLDFFEKGEKDALFERKAFTLARDGEISGLVEVAQGYEIIQRIAKKTVTYRPFKEVKDEVKNSVLRQLFMKQFTHDAKSLAHKKADRNALNLFAQEKQGNSTQLSLMPKDDSKRMQLIFKLQVGDADFYVEDNIGYIVLTTDNKNKYIPALDQVKTEVEADFIQHHTEEALQQRLKEALQDIAAGSVQYVVKQYGAAVRETGFIQKGDESIKQLREEGVPVEQMFQIENKGGAVSAIQKDGYIFYLSGICEPSNDDILKQRNERLGVMNNEIMGLFIQGFIASLSRNATLEINESLFTHIEK